MVVTPTLLEPVVALAYVEVKCCTLQLTLGMYHIKQLVDHRIWF